MAIPKIYNEIIDKISEQTENGLIEWNKNPFEIFEAHLGTNYVRLWAGKDENEESFVSFALIDKEKEPLDSWFVDAYENDYTKMKELYDNVLRSRQELREAIQNLSITLKNQDS
ncbi:hypothetical protein LVJ85_09580 [Neisseria sp. Dent CA1/247]|uniref:hypothetical protein n=1 Tax=Neisseria TaxID=482 RepID=UPI000A18D94E|nr:MULTISPECIES: hypothetical protein [Neisseria]OSI14156.1 hypothetical protein BV914_10775 [Neisseria dumasiana]UOO76278.1 hypothetical protein LVJ85_09580 [Neisseria sp. Dent CA1/247]